jgi:L-idonate 5-dehydrogenase
MRGVVIHGARDLRVEEIAVAALGPRDVRIRIEAGGICGSDLHYYLHGGFGAVRVREPMVLGHEIAGTVDAVGADVTRVRVGERVAINPSLPCGACRFCQAGQQNHCLDMRFYGSAMRTPHMQGGFRDLLVCEEARATPTGPEVSASEAAFAEPLAVCLHAAKRAGPLLGRRVLVTGCGPIGVLAIVAAKIAGAAEIVATDVTDAPLPLALRMGATTAANVARDRDALSAYAKDKGWFDVLFEASGQQAALVGAFDALRPGAVLTQIGLGGEMTLPMNSVVAKEFELRGAFRFVDEFALAVELISARRVDLSPLLTATIPLARAVEAFDLAADRARAMKVQLSFG